MQYQRFRLHFIKNDIFAKIKKLAKSAATCKIRAQKQAITGQNLVTTCDLPNDHTNLQIDQENH